MSEQEREYPENFAPLEGTPTFGGAIKESENYFADEVADNRSTESYDTLDPLEILYIRERESELNFLTASEVLSDFK